MDANGWQDIATAPRDEPILLWDGEVITVGKWLPSERHPFLTSPNWHGYTEDLDVYATHWQPIPGPPKE